MNAFTDRDLNAGPPLHTKSPAIVARVLIIPPQLPSKIAK